MNANNNLPAEKKVTFSTAISTPAYQGLINRTFTDPARAKRFIANITSAVAVNPTLQDCAPATILAGAMLGESLNLASSPQLGQFYLVPFEEAVKDANGNVVYLLDENGNKLKDSKGRWVKQTVKKASFILGWKGYLQLAIRSGYYKRINVIEVKQGELKKWDPFTEEFEAEPILDADTRAAAKTIGYVASFEYLNGFTKTLYWSYEQMLRHADTYSKAFSRESYKDLIDGRIPDSDLWKYSSFWYKDFDGMARKTMLRQLISKYGIMSTELQTAFEHDDSVNNVENGAVVFGTPDAMDAAGVDAVDATPTEVAKDEVPYTEAKAINFNEVP